MKTNHSLISLIFLLLIVTLVLTAAHQARKDEAITTPTQWLPPQLTPDPVETTLAPGWWSEIPTAIPFPSPTQRK